MEAMTLRIPGLPTPRSVSIRREAARELFAEVAWDYSGTDRVVVQHEPDHRPWPLLRFTRRNCIAIALSDDDGVIRVGPGYGDAANSEPLPLRLDADAARFVAGSAGEVFRAAVALLRDHDPRP